MSDLADVERLPSLPAGGPIRIRTFYPADPIGTVPGGVDTFIRGLVKWAPADLEFSVVGMTTDPAARPIGRWTQCETGARSFQFFPVVAVKDAGTRSWLPLSVRYTAGLLRWMSQVRGAFDVMEFHRIEPALALGRDPRPRNAFFHQDMGVIRVERQADILWRHLPGLYFALEGSVMRRLSSAWCVREQGVEAMQKRYPAMAERIRFIPTWVDFEVFGRPTPVQREDLRRQCAAQFGLDPSATWLVTVGRLDQQKDPQLMLEAVRMLVQGGHRLQWLIVGDGVLRSSLEVAVQAAQLGQHVRWAGLRRPAEIASILQAADVYGLSSAYEGMPMALLEAMCCGLPVATTDVGEVRRVVKPGQNGQIAVARSPDAFAQCLQAVVQHAGAWGGEAAAAAVEPFQPQQVLAPVYASYRAMGLRWRAG